MNSQTKLSYLEQLEIEAKIKVPENKFNELISRLGDPVFYEQHNYFYRDNLGRIIRLRIEQDKIILTHKSDANHYHDLYNSSYGPLNADFPAKYKVKKEKEIIINDSSLHGLEQILAFFDFKQIFYYKKERATCHLCKCTISLDKLNHSCDDYYVEIEGLSTGITSVIKTLALDNFPLLTTSYLELLGGIKWVA